MKKFKMMSLMTILTLSSILYAQSKEEASDLYKAAEGAVNLKEDIQNVGSIEAPCPNCKKLSANKTYLLDFEEFEIDTPYYLKANEPYVIHFKRHARTPKKVRVNFKNGERVCGKYVGYTNPYNGAIGIDCLFYSTHYETEVFDLGFSKMSPVKDGAEEVYEIRISKSNLNRSAYQFEVNHFADKKVIVETDKKFWVSGHNINFKE